MNLMLEHRLCTSHPGRLFCRTTGMLALCLLAFLITSTCVAESVKGNGNSGILPPNSTPGGQTLQEWLVQYMNHVFTGEPASGMVGNVLLLPAPNTYGGQGHLQLTVKSSTLIFYVVEAQIGCLWWNDVVSDPALLVGWHDSLTTRITLDGAPVLRQLDQYYVPPTWFDVPIYFPPSKSHKAPVAAMWTEGFGFMIAPLPIGEHTMTCYVQDAWTGLVWDESWTIMVVD